MTSSEIYILGDLYDTDKVKRLNKFYLKESISKDIFYIIKLLTFSINTLDDVFNLFKNLSEYKIESINNIVVAINTLYQTEIYMTNLIKKYNINWRHTLLKLSDKDKLHMLNLNNITTNKHLTKSILSEFNPKIVDFK